MLKTIRATTIENPYSLIALCGSILGLLSALLIFMIYTDHYSSLVYCAVVIPGSFVLLLNTFRSTVRLQRYQWLFALLCMFVGVAISLFVVEPSCSGMFACTLYRGFPRAWLMQYQVLSFYLAPSQAEQYMAQHAQNTQLAFMGHSLLIDALFYGFAGILLATLAGLIVHTFVQRKNREVEDLS